MGDLVDPQKDATKMARIPLTIVAPGGRTPGVLVAVLVSDLDALEAENERLREARASLDTEQSQ